MRNKSASECASFALADSKARQWVSKLQTLNQEESEDGYRGTGLAYEMAEWTSQLVALHHPFVTDSAMDAAELVEGAEFPNDDNEGIRCMDFCGTVNILHRQHLTGSICRKSENHLLEAVINWDFRYPPTTLMAFALAHRTWDTRLTPCPSKIPFSSFTNFPLPFAGIPFKNPEGSFHQTMTSKGFLEDGEWVGYCSNDLAENTYPLVTRVNFNVSDTVRSWVRSLKGSGEYSFGRFTLSGKIEVWGFDVTETHVTGATRRWGARMTPFGIIGCWGKDGEKQGDVWFWKKTWTDQE